MIWVDIYIRERGTFNSNLFSTFKTFNCEKDEQNC